MNSVQQAVFPGVLIGSLCLFFLTGLIANPQIVLASSDAIGQTVASAVESQVTVEGQTSNPADPEVGANTVPVESGAGAGENCTLSASVRPEVRQWCPLVMRYAEENNLDPNLIAAVMTQESGGNPQAYSKSGAVGLMQVMPRDGLAAGFMCPNGPCFASRPSMEELFDPEFNIAYGTRMLAGLIQKHGNVRDALMKYGPANVGYYYADIVLNIYSSYR
jgi:hypothetical protein